MSVKFESALIMSRYGNLSATCDIDRGKYNLLENVDGIMLEI